MDKDNKNAEINNAKNKEAENKEAENKEAENKEAENKPSSNTKKEYKGDLRGFKTYKEAVNYPHTEAFAKLDRGCQEEYKAWLKTIM